MDTNHHLADVLPYKPTMPRQLFIIGKESIQGLLCRFKQGSEGHFLVKSNPAIETMGQGKGHHIIILG